tara:strand:- start:686 stop:853 length:168 start_codon:yes stop_codon:yes gene_type:complete
VVAAWDLGEAGGLLLLVNAVCGTVIGCIYSAAVILILLLPYGNKVIGQQRFVILG